MRQVLWIFEMLTDIRGGIYTQWVYYTDGTVEEFKVPKGPIIVPRALI